MGYTFYSEVGVPGQNPIVWYHFKVPGDRAEFNWCSGVRRGAPKLARSRRGASIMVH